MNWICKCSINKLDFFNSCLINVCTWIVHSGFWLSTRWILTCPTHFQVYNMMFQSLFQWKSIDLFYFILLHNQNFIFTVWVRSLSLWAILLLMLIINVCKPQSLSKCKQQFSDITWCGASLSHIHTNSFLLLVIHTIGPFIIAASVETKLLFLQLTYSCYIDLC